MTNYTWKAYYSIGGDSLSQFNLDGSENLFKDIDTSRIILFVLSQNHTKSLLDTDFVLSLPDGVFILKGVPIIFGRFDSNRLIYFRRNLVAIGSPNDSQKVYHILGIQATINGKNRKVLFKIDDKTQDIELLYD
jgi:hypothetical protein